MLPDNRPSLAYLYAQYKKFQAPPFFDKAELLCIYEGHATVAYIADHRQRPLSALSDIDPTPAIWIISGIHGDEPAGPVAISSMAIPAIAQRMSTVIIPVMAPFAYVKNERTGGTHYELSNMFHRTGMVAKETPAQDELGDAIVRLAGMLPPRVIISLHEDDRYIEPYCYVFGELDVAYKLAWAGMAAMHPAAQGVPRWGEQIVSGTAVGTPDGSVEDFLTSSNTIGVTFECGAKGHPLSVRVERNQIFLSNVLDALEENLA